jgi:hypothetical protein
LSKPRHDQPPPDRAAWTARCLAAACAALAAYTFGLVYEGFAADHYSSALITPFVDRPAARRAYQRLSFDAPAATREAAARRLVEADPANPNGWNAVSYARFLAAGKMSPAAIEALDHGYAVSAFDRRSAVWRIGFALDNWAALTPALRRNVLAEAGPASADPALAPELQARLRSVRSPEGRLAAALVMATPRGAADAVGVRGQ